MRATIQNRGGNGYNLAVSVEMVHIHSDFQKRDKKWTVFITFSLVEGKRNA